MGWVKNADRVTYSVDVWIKRLAEMHVAYYREVVELVFRRLLNKTPQFSGKAVANWNIGIGGPDYNFDDALGDEIAHTFGAAGIDRAHRKGDRKWIDRALRRNLPKLKLIRRGTTVYFNNAVQGDDDEGGQILYMEALQDPAYWVKKLRQENQPYETAQETLQMIGRGLLFRAGGSFRDDA